MFKDDLLRDRRILVTGGGTGLGKAMARRFLSLGARVTICGRRESVLAETKAEFDAAFGARTTTRPCDIRDAAAVEAMVEGIWSEKGGLDTLVNNAAGNFIANTWKRSSRVAEAALGIVLPD